ncbi:MAG: hypothetical protein EA406_04160 [Rhodospirillales bacterium]|nr:MAG: hypothetical protein EA406_04160 [Rhodospirillales bacterium]
MSDADAPGNNGNVDHGTPSTRADDLFVPTFHDYLALLRARRWFIIVFTAAAALSALTLTFVVSERYEAEAALFYRPQEVTRLTGKEAQAFGSPVPQAPFKVISQTMQEVVSSDAILRPTVLALSLHDEPKVYEGAWYVVLYRRTKDWAFDVVGDAWSLAKYGRIIEPDALEKTVEQLRSNVRLRSRDSYVFELRVRHKRPDRAAEIANEIAGRMVEWLNRQDAAPSELRSARVSGLIVGKEQEIALIRRTLQEMLERERVASASLEAERATTRLHELALARLRTDAEIVETQSQIEAIRARQGQARDFERIRTGGVVEVIQPEDARRLVSERLFSEVRLSGLLARRDTLSQQIDELELRVALLPTIQREVDRLQLQLEVGALDLVQLRNDLQEAQLRQSSAGGELRLLSEAQVPLQPVSPIKVYHTGLALTLALLLSIGLTIAFTLLNIRILFPSRGPRARGSGVEAAAGIKR